jgi:catechol-2,3-dioxygenase
MGVTGIHSVWFFMHDIARLRNFYIEVLGAEPLTRDHEPIRVGHTVLVFMQGDPQENKLAIGFDADAAGFDQVVEKAKKLAVLERGPVQHTAVSKGLFLRDPDGRQIEIVHNDLGIFWQN